MTLATATFLLSAWLTYRLTHPQTILYIVNEPNDRSLHIRPIPATGGVAILTAWLLSSSLTCLPEASCYPLSWMYLSGALIAVISLIDDYRHVPALYRLIIHFLAAYLFLSHTDFWLTDFTLPYLKWSLSPFWQISLTLLLVVWMVNLYNFMDGMDGFAAGMAILGFSSLAMLGGFANQNLFMTVNLLIVSSVAGFLLFNFPPAKIFMGDVGASSLGFLAATFSLWGNHAGIFPFWLALLIFSPFIVDATVTLMRRLLHGEKIWLAHKSHYYQRLVQLGWGHQRTVLWEYVLMAGCSSSALLAIHWPPMAQGLLLIGWGLIYGLLMYGIKKLERRL